MCHTYTTRLGYIIILNTMDIGSVYGLYIHHTSRMHNHIYGYRIHGYIKKWAFYT